MALTWTVVVCIYRVSDKCTTNRIQAHRAPQNIVENENNGHTLLLRSQNVKWLIR